MHTCWRHFLLFDSLVLSAAITAPALAQGACPPLISGLLPKNGGSVSGNYQAMGMMGKGWGVAKLPYEQRCPCLKKDKFRAQISIEVLHYEGDGVQLFKMQIDSVEQQTLQNAMQEYARKQPKPTPANRVKSARREAVPGGTLVYYEYVRQCPGDCIPDGSPPEDYAIPVITLQGVSHTESSSVVVKIEGDLPADLAKAAAQEVFANLKKARFGHPAPS